MGAEFLSCWLRGIMNSFDRRGASALVLGALFLVTSCASMQDVQEASTEDAATQNFSADYRRVVDAGIAGINGMKLSVSSVSDEQDRTVILFQRPQSMWQIGAVGRMIVENSAPSPIVVHINYEQRGKITYSSGQERWARAIFARMEKELGVVAAK
jgi:hypothetical protein